MVKHKLLAALLMVKNHASFWYFNKSLLFANLSLTPGIRNSQIIKIVKIIAIAPTGLSAFFRIKLKKVIKATFNNQIVQMNGNVQGSSVFYPYNFTGSPQSLYWLPENNRHTPYADQQNHIK